MSRRDIYSTPLEVQVSNRPNGVTAGYFSHVLSVLRYIEGPEAHHDHRHVLWIVKIRPRAQRDRLDALKLTGSDAIGRFSLCTRTSNFIVFVRLAPISLERGERASLKRICAARGSIAESTFNRGTTNL